MEEGGDILEVAQASLFCDEDRGREEEKVEVQTNEGAHNNLVTFAHVKAMT